MSKKFEYKYSAPTEEERKEIEHIKRQYQEKSERGAKLERLRNLDNKVKNTPAVVALVLGIAGVLIFGLGLTMILEWQLFIWGVIVSILGFVPMTVAYFAYNKVYEILKNRYSEQIIKISSELLNDEREGL